MVCIILTVLLFSLLQMELPIQQESLATCVVWVFFLLQKSLNRLNIAMSFVIHVDLCTIMLLRALFLKYSIYPYMASLVVTNKYVTASRKRSRTAQNLECELYKSADSVKRAL